MNYLKSRNENHYFKIRICVSEINFGQIMIIQLIRSIKNISSQF